MMHFSFLSFIILGFLSLTFGCHVQYPTLTTHKSQTLLIIPKEQIQQDACSKLYETKCLEKEEFPGCYVIDSMRLKEKLGGSNFAIVGLGPITKVSKVDLGNYIKTFRVYNAKLQYFNQDSLVNRLSLKHVDLRRNSIANIPKGSLPSSLIQLDLSGNALTKIPEDIASMKKLEDLSIDDVSLSSAPKGSLPQSLTSLFMMNAGLKEVPQDVPTLKLMNLYLSGNPLSRIESNTLPSTISLLDLKNTTQPTVPKDIRRMTFLTYLDLSHNKLDCIYRNSIPVKTISILDLSGTNLHSVPRDIKQMKQLTMLSMKHNSLGRISKGKLPTSLKSLHLGHSKMRDIPQGLSRKTFPNLILLDMHSNPISDAMKVQTFDTLSDMKSNGVEIILTPTTKTKSSCSGELKIIGKTQVCVVDHCKDKTKSI